MKKWFIALLTTALTACGGGGSSSPTAPVQTAAVTTPASAPPSTTPTNNVWCTPLGATVSLIPGAQCHAFILVRGDSTLWGVDVDYTDDEQQAPGVGNGIVGRAHTTPVQYWQQKADAEFGPGVVTFVDQAIPGSTFPSDLNGTPPSLNPFAVALATGGVHYDAAISNSEINDQYVLGLPYSTYGVYAQQWAETACASGTRPIFMEPNLIVRQPNPQVYDDPTYGTFAMVAEADTMIGNYDNSKGCRGAILPVTQAWANYTSPPNPQPWNIAFLSSDNTHPNDAGYAFKANASWPALDSIITQIVLGVAPQ